MVREPRAGPGLRLLDEYVQVSPRWKQREHVGRSWSPISSKISHQSRFFRGDSNEANHTLCFLTIDLSVSRQIGRVERGIPDAGVTNSCGLLGCGLALKLTAGRLGDLSGF